MGGWLTWLPAPRRPLAGPSVISTNVPDATVKRMRLPRRTALPARQCPGELAYRLLMLLVPDFGKVAGDLKLHTLVQRDLPRTFFPDTFIKIGDRRAQRAGDLKQSSGRNAIDAALIFMSLLTRYPDHFGESLLGQAHHNAALADPPADMVVGRDS
jgi:hypothetical protein